MAWLRMSDNLATDPVILNVCNTRGDKTRVLGWVTELMLYCASHLTDGFVPELIYRDVVRSKKWREALTNPPSGGTALFHRRGDSCECLKDRVWPDTAADLFVHLYMESNPSREEYDVQRAKTAELRDRELQAAVRHRDRGMCRYCGARVRWADRRSSLGGVFDHVDPKVAGGAANLVVACRGCNSRKGNRTPDGARMTLLPVPGDQVAGADQATDPVTDVPGDHAADPDPVSDLAGDLTRTNWSALDPTTHAPVRDGTGRDGLRRGGDRGETRSPHGAGASAPAPPTPIGPPTTTRTSAHPNPYLRTAITGPDPLDHAGLPDPDAFDAFADPSG